MRTDLLLRMADLLEADAKNPSGIKYDQNTWGFGTEGRPPSVSCGTTACAMGLAALSRAFADEGLTARAVPNGNKNLIRFSMHGQTANGMDAAKELFGIDEGTADDLFGYKYRGVTTGAEAEIALAKKIRELCAKNA